MAFGNGSSSASEGHLGSSEAQRKTESSRPPANDGKIMLPKNGKTLGAVREMRGKISEIFAAVKPNQNNG